jgi:hypothetical protein
MPQRFGYCRGDMKTQLTTSPIHTHGIDNSSVSLMDMDLEGMKQACQIFRDNIYSNKILAVVREWTCNAVDEHLKHSIERPVSIGIQNEKFFVRDYAKGLSDENVRNVFGKYFRSTKSNSDQPIGGFGVGAKAGHCYNDVFYVTSFYEGKKTLYSCILGGDETGASIGQVVEIHSEPTTESGLLVEIEINNAEDKATFIKEAKSAAVLTTLANVEVVVDSLTLDLGGKELLAEENGIRLYKLEDKHDNRKQLLSVTMGGVFYELPKSQSPYDFSKSTPLQSLQLDVPVGYFDVPISRESFRDTPKFKASYEKAVQVITNLIAKESAQFANRSIEQFIINTSFKSDHFNLSCKLFLPLDLAGHCIKSGVVGDLNSPVLTDKQKVVIAEISESRIHASRQKQDLESFAKRNNKLIIIATNGAANNICHLLKHYQMPDPFVIKKSAAILRTPNTNPSTSSVKQCDVTQTRFSVRTRFGSRTDYKTVAEICSEKFNKQFASIDEIKQHIANEKAKICNLSLLNEYTIEGALVLGYRTSSQKMKKAFASVGIFDKDTDEYRNTHKTLADFKSIIINWHDQAHKKCQAISKFLSNRTLNKIDKILSDLRYKSYLDDKIKSDMAKVDRKIKRLECRLNAILKVVEKNEIAELFVSYLKKDHYFRPNRASVRKVLKVKVSA